MPRKGEQTLVASETDGLAEPFVEGEDDEEDMSDGDSLPSSDVELEEGEDDVGGELVIDSDSEDDDELDRLAQEAPSDSDDEEDGLQEAGAGQGIDQEDDEDEEEEDEDEDEEAEEEQGLGRKRGRQGGESESGDEEEDSDDDEHGPGHKAAKFTEGEKGASFAKAFSKIVERKVKGLPAADSVQAGTAGAGVVAPILVESKSLAARLAADAAEAVVRREARQRRQEAKRAGHAGVPVRGEDPAHDQREKQLTKLATKGVVLLFNAVTKAQRAAQEAGAAGSKASKVTKSAFLQQIKGQAGAGEGSGVLGLLGAKKAAAGQAADADKEGQPGWKVLQDSFTGLAGGQKMKDWDKEQDGSDEEGAQVDGNSDSDNGDDAGW